MHCSTYAKKWISFILTLSLMISGLCFQNAKAESFCAPASKDESMCTISMRQGIFLNKDLCPENLLGAHYQEISMGYAGHVHENECGKNLLTIMLPTKRPSGSLISYVNHSPANDWEFSGRCATIRYIHNTDGSKG